jgi:hypothetical protein
VRARDKTKVRPGRFVGCTGRTSREVKPVICVATPHGDSTPYRERTLPDGRRVAFKVVQRGHELRCLPGGGAACDESVLTLEGEGFSGVWLHRQTTKEDFWAPFSSWRVGRPINFGFGPQLALPWSQMELLPSSLTQLRLFEGG